MDKLTARYDGRNLLAEHDYFNEIGNLRSHRLTVGRNLLAEHDYFNDREKSCTNS